MNLVRLACMAMVWAALGSLPLGAAETAAPAQTVAPTQTPAEPSLNNPLAAMPLDRLSETRERPLFTPSRRKPPPEVAAEPPEPSPPPPPAPPKLALYGIIQDEAGARAI